MPDALEHLQAALSDRYAIQRELGQGGMATVWLATDLRHHRDVALKVLRPELAAAVGPERFLREIELAARLNHPHILPLHDSGEAAGLLYYVMPYVEGESLRDRLRREKQLSVDEALRISREVADALSYAHAHGVIHRDIKPENILLESGHAVVADFGIARAIEQSGGPGLTGTGVALGTPAYVSPEQAAGSKEVDGRSDLYSLACVLFEMLAGRPPFVASSPESVVYQHLSAPPPPITSFRPAVPAQVAGTLERALAKVPADRFNPVALFAEALGPGLSTGWSAASGGPRAASRPAASWHRPVLIGVATVAVVAGAMVLSRWVRPPAGRAGTAGLPEQGAIAVLPFQNLSADGPYAYFAGGLHDELLTQLARVSALSVRGRTSVMGYAGTSKSIPVIAEELSVGTIVEGSVQVVGDRLRVNVQLIDAATDDHLWAERYDRTLDDAFAVQSEIAERIVAAVGAALPGAEAAALANSPTESAEAYQLYLQGLEYWRRPGRLRADLENALPFFERAVQLDPSFALAYAALSEVHGRIFWLGYDMSPSRLVSQQRAVDAALGLDVALPRAHFAMGWAHYIGRDWQAALREYRVALEGLPNDAEVWEAIGFVNRRMGRWDAVDSALSRSTTLDPRDGELWEDSGGGTLSITRRYPGAVDAYNRALDLAPDLHLAAARKAWVYLLWKGQPDTLRSVLDGLLPGTQLGPLGSETAQRAELHLLSRKPDSLLALLHDARESVFESQNFYLPTSLYAGWAHSLRRDQRAAQASFGSAQVLLDSVAAVFPDDWRVHAARGLASAPLRRRSDALTEATWLKQSIIYRDDAFLGPRLWEARALILATVGETDDALTELERLLSGPTWISAHTLRLDPRWDPIRDDPRFQALLVKYAEPQPVL